MQGHSVDIITITLKVDHVVLKEIFNSIVSIVSMCMILFRIRPGKNKK